MTKYYSNVDELPKPEKDGRPATDAAKHFKAYAQGLYSIATLAQNIRGRASDLDYDISEVMDSVNNLASEIAQLHTELINLTTSLDNLEYDIGRSEGIFGVLDITLVPDEDPDPDA